MSRGPSSSIFEGSSNRQNGAFVETLRRTEEACGCGRAAGGPRRIAGVAGECSHRVLGGRDFQLSALNAISTQVFLLPPWVGVLQAQS